MLRVHLTTEDLARLRIRSTNRLAAETLHGLDGLRRGTDPQLVSRWQERFGSERLPGEDLRHTTKLLADLWSGAFDVDLVTVLGGPYSVHEGLDAFRQAPCVIVNAKAQKGIEALSRIYGSDALYRPHEGIREEPGRVRRMRYAVAAAVREFRQSALAPGWERTQTHLDAEYTRLAWSMAESGIDAMLDSLHPNIRWRPPVLEVDAGVEDLDFYPDGRGLTIVPSLFSPLGHMASADLKDPSGTFGLFYPAVSGAQDPPLVSSHRPPTHKVLAALLGSTRANVLQAIAEAPCTTGELASRVGASLSSASQHATVLRNAGLITTRREGAAVRHQLTPRGSFLLS